MTNISLTEYHESSTYVLNVFVAYILILCCLLLQCLSLPINFWPAVLFRDLALLPSSEVAPTPIKYHAPTSCFCCFLCISPLPNTCALVSFLSPAIFVFGGAPSARTWPQTGESQEPNFPTKPPVCCILVAEARTKRIYNWEYLFRYRLGNFLSETLQ